LVACMVDGNYGKPREVAVAVNNGTISNTHTD
jgi:hypothetical protein